MLAWLLASHLVTQVAGGGILSFALGNLKRDAKALRAWLCHRSFWQLVSMGLALAWGVDHVSCHRHAAHLEKQLSDALKARDDYKRQLDSISNRRDTQKQATEQNLRTVTRTVHDADERAKQVETAPPPGNCKTAKQVLDADV
jgi:hypothetical protein